MSYFVYIFNYTCFIFSSLFWKKLRLDGGPKPCVYLPWKALGETLWTFFSLKYHILLEDHSKYSSFVRECLAYVLDFSYIAAVPQCYCYFFSNITCHLIFLFLDSIHTSKHCNTARLFRNRVQWLEIHCLHQIGRPLLILLTFWVLMKMR